MNRSQNKKGSIYGRLTKLLILAALAAALAFFLLDNLVSYCIYTYTTDTGYVERQDSKRIEKLQSYVTEKDLASADASGLTEWVKKQSVVAIQVYQNGIMVYDSNYPEEDLGDEAGQHSWERFYPVTFSDGTAQVLLYGFYAYQFYSYGLIGSLILAFALFTLIVLLGIRKTIRYILTLSQEIKILEGGDLSYPITVSGHDELSRLAQGLDDMRQSFQAQTEKGTQLAQANQRMITEMSHDLRTPLTSIMLYTEILLKGKYDDTAQMMGYVAKIDQKARSLKHLTDHLFEYALITSETEVKLEDPAPLRAVFYDMLSETAAYLEQQGFHIHLDLSWEERYIRVNRDYIARIFDNFTSNLVKYADKAAEVRMQTVYADHSAGFLIQNKKAAPDEKTESTKIGLQNIRNMMRQMGGRAAIEQDECLFSLSLQFPEAAKP